MFEIKELKSLSIIYCFESGLRLEIKGFIDVSFADWDGKISSVMFLPNCNFRCPFCHNVNLVLHSEKLPTIPLEQVERQLKKQKSWIDGVCVTGGEPTLHSNLPELCSRLKKIGYLVKVDTNGTNPIMLKELVEQGLVDYVAMDMKAPLTVKKYSEATGVKAEKLLEKVRESVELLLKSDLDYEFRTTVVPSLHDMGDIRQICLRLRGCRKYVLQRFDSGLGKATIDHDFMSKSFTEEEMQKFLAIAKKVIPKTKLR